MADFVITTSNGAVQCHIDYGRKRTRERLSRERFREPITEFTDEELQKVPIAMIQKLYAPQIKKVEADYEQERHA